jgi:flagellar hook-associated protein 3 FlgL
MMRVTNQSSQQTALNNIFRISEDLSNTQNSISSGKRIQRFSDDPSGTRQVLSTRTSISQNNQFIRNINNNKGFVSNADTALETITLSLIKAKELVVSQLGGTATATTRSFTAEEVRGIVSQTVVTANSKIGNRFLFAGDKVDVSPFSVSASGAVYQGNSGEISLTIGESTRLQLNLAGGDVFSVDLNPTVDSNTVLSDLNNGQGITEGSFVLNDRAGNSATVTVNAGGTVDSVITTINNAGLNITASINDSNSGIKLTDSSSLINQSLSVTESNSGSTAQSLGLIGERNGTMQGMDLNPQINRSTTLSQLNGGQGLDLTAINITNGSASGTVSFSSLNSSSSIGDALDLMNNAGLNITAGIGSDGKGLKIVSNSLSTVAIAREVGAGNSAELLGLGGGRNILSILLQTQQALERNDPFALIALTDSLDTALNSLSGSRASLGTVTRRLEDNEFSLEKELVDKTERLSDIEDIDFAQAASNLAALELAFQSTLAATARIIQPTLLNFLD